MFEYLEYDISKCWHRLKTPQKSLREYKLDTFVYKGVRNVDVIFIFIFM